MRTRRPFVSTSSATPARVGSADLISVSFANIDTLIGQTAEQHRGELRIIARHCAGGLDNRDGSTELAVGLREFDAARARANNDEVVGEPIVVENGLVREIRYGFDAGDRRNRRLRTRRDHDMSGADRAVTGGNRPRPDKACLGAQYVNPKPLETLDQIMRRDRLHDAAHVPANRGEIDIRPGAANPKAAGTPYSVRGFGGGEQRLRRHAAAIEAFAAHFGPFDQDRARAELGADRGRGQPGGAGPDHA